MTRDDRQGSPRGTLAFGDIAARFRRRILVFAARRLRTPGAAEDVAQETLRRVTEALDAGRVNDLDALPGFVLQTARHVCLRRLRDRARRARAIERMSGEPARASDDPLGTLIAEERREEVRRALAGLQDGDRGLLEALFAEGLDIATASERLGASPGAIRVRKHRALARLRDALDPACNDPPPAGTKKR